MKPAGVIPLAVRPRYRGGAVLTAYLWSWMSPAQREAALASALQHDQAYVRMLAQKFQTLGDNADDRAGIWVDHGEGRWYVGAALWAEDLVRGVRLGERP
jgi:hypothetical protein